MGQSSPYRVVLTADGSRTVFSEVFNAHFHSIHGAITESNHVFIQAGLKEKLKSSREISVLEVGFGTGLNGFLTYCEALDNNAFIHYTAIEKFPLPAEIYRQLDYPDRLNRKELEADFLQFHEQDSFSLSTQKMSFIFHKVIADIHALEIIPGSHDLVYYDAFAPVSQEDMWDTGLLGRISDALNAGGALVTYCAKGQFRRDLQSLGLTVERIPGPPGKREMIRATK